MADYTKIAEEAARRLDVTDSLGEWIAIILSAIEQAREQDRELIGRLVGFLNRRFTGSDEGFLSVCGARSRVCKWCKLKSHLYHKHPDGPYYTPGLADNKDKCTNPDCDAVIARTLIAEAKEVETP